MPDTFTNQRAYYDVTFPTSGDAFSISGHRNAFMGLGSMDFIPLQPRAHNPGDMKIMVRGQDASSFYNPVYFGDSNNRITFSSGDTSSFSAPAANPRIDIVYLTPSGDIRVVTGTEAAAPTLPTLAPSGDSRFPICAIWLKPSMAKIVNFEDKDTNSGDGYIYKDLRPWCRMPSTSYPDLRVVNLADAATISVDTAAGDTFDVTISGNRTIGIPKNPRDSKKILLRIKASGADRTPTFTTGDNGFRFGDDVAIPGAITSGKTNYYGACYKLDARRWDVLGVMRGY